MKILASTLFTLMAFAGVAQVSDTLVFEDTPLNASCRSVAQRSHTYLSTLRYTQVADIAAVLDGWEKQCGISEPLLRAKILLQMQQRLNADELVRDFIPDYYRQFELRVSDWVFIEVYDDDPERFGYVPFESAFDQWTQEWALQLIDWINYGTDEFLACALFTENIEKFDELMSSGDFNETLTWRSMKESQKDRWDPRGTASLHIGIWQPLGTMRDAFGSSVELGGSGGGLLSRSSGVRLEAVLKLRPMVNRDGVTLLIDNRFENTTARLLLSIGGQATKAIPLRKNYLLDFGGGAEYVSLATRYLKPKQHFEDEDTYYSVSTYNVFCKAVIRRALKNNRSIGIYATLNYSPFSNDRDLGKFIGDSYLTFGLEYRPTIR